MAAPPYRILAEFEQGESHKQPPEKECQDYALCQAGKGYFLAVTADGHGSNNNFRSSLGSRFAVECARDGIDAFIGTIRGSWFQKKELPEQKAFEEMLRSLIKHIVAAWHGKVEEHYRGHPFSQEDLAGVSEKYRNRYEAGERCYRAYGTTLIAAAVAPNYWFGFHIGDGSCTVFYRDGSSQQPIPWDERCYHNITTSICDEDAAETARIYYKARTEQEIPAMIFLGSDGVDDSFPVGDNQKHLAGFYRTLVLNFLDEIKTKGEAGFEAGVKQIKEFLPSLSKRGSGDDVAISAIINLEALKEMEGIFRQQAQEEEEEKRRAEAEQAAREAEEEAAWEIEKAKRKARSMLTQDVWTQDVTAQTETPGRPSAAGELPEEMKKTIPPEHDSEE
jgi:hypothetical protein